MLKSKTRWLEKEVDYNHVTELASNLNITPLVAKLLVCRGLSSVEEARKFLYCEDQEFHDPFLLKDMDIAVQRIKKAIDTQEAILIFGDYDADGVSSTTVLMKTLLELGANVDFYIPNRFTEGYGPNETAFRKAAERGIGLIITVDTGISALHEAQIAKELGIDLIITDHHEPGEVLPEALAIIHPKREDSHYPFRDLAGVGVAFKLSHALYGRVPEDLLEIAVIGTIADLVSLRDENRLIAIKGIKRLRTTKNPGLRALLKMTSTDLDNVTEETIGFTLGPRINAAGRLGSADPAVHLLLTSDEAEAAEIAAEIDLLNKERQDIVNSITEEAIQQVEQLYPPEKNSVLVIGKEGWNSGVIGIVASKLVEKYYRPTIVLSYDEEKRQAKGSARSIEGFDLFKNLSLSRDILPHFGGHPMAAGMTLNLEHVDELRIRLNKLAKAQLTEDDFKPVTMLDGSFEISEITLNALKEMQMLAPFGVDNPKPKVMIDEVNIANIRKIGANQNHMKITLEREQSALDGVGFGLGHLCDHISPFSQLSVIGELSINEWNNIRKPQIFLQDLAIHSWQLFDFRGTKRFEKLSELIPSEQRSWVIFNKDLVGKFSPILADGNYIVVDSEEVANSIEVSGRNLVLLDLPPSKSLLESFLAEKSPSRVYAHFYKEDSDFFSTLPTREHFKWYYAFLSKRGTFDLNRYGDDLAKYRGWSKETVVFMSQVFFELDFVKINNGFISLNKSVPKRDLTESKTYQQKVAQYTLENDLLYSSFQQLKGWFDDVMQGAVKNEEAIKEWT